MLRLVLDVMPHGFDLRGTDGKGTITTLPGKLRDSAIFLHPFRGFDLCGLHRIRERDSARKAKERMHMIRHAADDDGGTTNGLKRAGQISVEAGMHR